MVQELGREWEGKVKRFDKIPFAAASIGQVHYAQLHSGQRVAVKVQYPGVATSIRSDLKNLRLLVTFNSLLPKGLYLDNTIRVAEKELLWEVDYQREAENITTFRELLTKSQERTKGDHVFAPRKTFFDLPSVVNELSTKCVLTTEYIEGVPLSKLTDYPQDVRDRVGDIFIMSEH
jgi:aarF domain-containing kinase